MAVGTKLIEVQARRLLALEIAGAQRNWGVASKIEENQLGLDVNEAATIQCAYKKHKLENQLDLPHHETKSGTGAKHQLFKFPLTLCIESWH